MKNNFGFKLLLFLPIVLGVTNVVIAVIIFSIIENLCFRIIVVGLIFFLVSSIGNYSELVSHVIYDPDE